ncbi:hypothetical protein RDI58_029310 [Solanum bulbocastanum]|uniref:Uncharacterized protein n=1 Tax=Solanum bulbocastanum TaxID=147425 RepID=A0AAN8XZT5_SOLBU
MSSVPSKDQCRPESPYMHHKRDAVLDKREVSTCEIVVSSCYRHTVIFLF